MNGFDLVSNALVEAAGEYSDIDEYMKEDNRVKKRFLFWTWKVVKKYGLDSAKSMKLDNDLCKAKFKNLRVIIYGVPNKFLNCSTIPGYFGDLKELGIIGPVKDHDLHKNYRALKQMKFENIKTGPKKTVIFPTNKLKTISIFATYGMLSLLEPEERLAVYLHEIGHWNYLAKMIPRQILLHDDEFKQSAKTRDGYIIPFYNIQLLKRAMNIGFRRWDEYESDLYAVRGGYGDELKSAFTKLSIGPPKNMVDAFTYMEAKKTSTWIELQDKLTSRLNIGSGHPSMKHRKDQIDHAKRNKNYLK